MSQKLAYNYHLKKKSIFDITESITPAFESNDFCLFQGNCLELLPNFPDDFADMIFADPPYNLSNDGVTCYAGKTEFSRS